MDSNISYLYELTREKRLGEEESLRKHPNLGPVTPRCLKCGWAKDVVPHVCGKTANQITSELRREAEAKWRERQREAEKPLTLKIGGKRRSV